MEAKNTTFDLHGWLNKTLDKFREALTIQQIGRHSSQLLNSIAGEVTRCGTVEEVIIKFQQYGRFVDMGVGRGFQRGIRKQLGDQKYFKKRNASGQLHSVGRTPKPWFSKTKTREVARLRELLLAHHENLVLNQHESKLD